MINQIAPERAMSTTKKPSSSHWNAFPEAAGLELSAPQGGHTGERLDLNAELIFGQHPLSGQGVSFRLGVKTGVLRLNLEGCETVPGTRFAVRDQPATVEREVKREETESNTIKADGSAAVRFGFGRRVLRAMPRSAAGRQAAGQRRG